MGCKVQVHKNTDKRGTWAYHSVDGCYIATSTEHYRTHKCHIKATNKHRFCDTVQFQHKNITNPTLSTADKVSQDIAACGNAIKGVANKPQQQQLDYLKTLLENIDVSKLKAHSRQINNQPSPRVERNIDPDTTLFRVTRSMARMMQQLSPKPIPRVPKLPSATTSATKQRRRRPHIQNLTTAPAANTQSLTASQAKHAAPPATRT